MGGGSQFRPADGYVPRCGAIARNVAAIILLATIPMASAQSQTSIEDKAPDLRVIPHDRVFPTMPFWTGTLRLPAGNPIVSSGAVFENDGLFACPRGSGLFAISRDGVLIIFHEKRSSLPFSVGERRSIVRTASLVHCPLRLNTLALLRTAMPVSLPRSEVPENWISA